MKTSALLKIRPLGFALVLLLGLLCTGCSTNKEDQAFFEKGWWNPDKAASERMYGAKPPASDSSESEGRPVPRQQ